MSSLTIQSNGVVKGGVFNYSVAASPAGDYVTYDGSINVKIGWWSKTYPFNGVYNGKPGQFSKGHYKTPGDQDNADAIHTEVVDVDTVANQSHVAIGEDQFNLRGLLTLDISGADSDPIVIMHAHITADVHGISALVEATA